MSDIFFIPWDQRKNLIGLLSKAGLGQTIERNDITALKMHMGEKGSTGHIRPEFIKQIVGEIKRLGGKPFITDTNTIYHGMRSNAIDHLRIASEHGFSMENIGTPIIIADGPRGLSHVDVKIEGQFFKSVKIAAAIAESDSMVVASHFKGHLAAGFGGAIKNIGMGCGTRMGKFEMHSGIAPHYNQENCILCKACQKKCAHQAITIDKKVNIDKDRCVGCGECVAACRYNALEIAWGTNTKAMQQKMAEYAFGAVKGKRAIYINFLNHITENCDCLGADEKPLLEDIGILASKDPVAIDQACLDLVIKKAGDVFKKVHPNIDGTIQLEHAEAVGLGSRRYDLIAM